MSDNNLFFAENVGFVDDADPVAQFTRMHSNGRFGRAAPAQAPVVAETPEPKANPGAPGFFARKLSLGDYDPTGRSSNSTERGVQGHLGPASERPKSDQVTMTEWRGNQNRRPVHRVKECLGGFFHQ